ncbi:MAG: penicillin-binding protein activator [Woeseia sp.]
MGACATTDRFGGQPETRAENMAESGRHADAAAIYIDLASRASGAERDRLTMLAAEQWLDAGDGRRAISAMRPIPRPPDGEMLWLWSSNSAAIELWQGRPDNALRVLEPLSRQPLPLEYRSRVEALRADAWFQKDEPLRALTLYLQRENWLDSRQQTELSRQRLWAGLNASNPRTLRSAAETATDPLIQGWLSLAALATATGQQGMAWSSGVTRWQEAHRDHPANAVLAGMELVDRDALDHPRQIALLLPLSGQNAAAGQAVQNGFIGSYFSSVANFDASILDSTLRGEGDGRPSATGNSAGGTMRGRTIDSRQLDAGPMGVHEIASERPAGEDRPPLIRVYDVNAGGAQRAYERAVEDGAEFVVGPLLRPDVTALASQTTLPVPVLSLNYLPDDVLAPPGFYQFALAPEDEAASAAERAAAHGYSRAVALIPDNDWGRRVLSSFATEFERSGGTLLDYRSYQPATQDFSVEIESLMALTQSVQRYQRLRANMGGPLQFDPRRRQDAEFVFLAADAAAGRLIKAQLKFHYAGDLPVYSTSFIYAMDGRSDSDLNGLMFADTPWIISPHPWIEELPALYNKYWPSERRLGRLHAMGYDAYQLVAELFSARGGSMPELTGATGRLYLDGDGRVHRRLAWARFVGGRPVPLPEQPRESYGSPREAEDGAGNRLDDAWTPNR